MKDKKELKNTVGFLTKAALFSALIFVATSFLSIPLPIGYIHIGDGILFLAAAILPTPYAIGAAIIGAGLADLAAGYAIYIPATVVIKSITALAFSNKDNKIVTVRNIIALAVSALICAGGYYLYEALIYNSFVAPLVSVPLNVVQVICGGVVFVIFGTAIDKRYKLTKLFGQNSNK